MENPPDGKKHDPTKDTEDHVETGNEMSADEILNQPPIDQEKPAPVAYRSLFARSERRRIARRADDTKKLEALKRTLQPVPGDKPTVVPIVQPAADIPAFLKEAKSVPPSSPQRIKVPQNTDPHPYRTFFKGILKWLSGKK